MVRITKLTMQKYYSVGGGYHIALPLKCFLNCSEAYRKPLKRALHSRHRKVVSCSSSCTFLLVEAQLEPTPVVRFKRTSSSFTFTKSYVHYLEMHFNGAFVLAGQMTCSQPDHSSFIDLCKSYASISKSTTNMSQNNTETRTVSNSPPDSPCLR